jgi:hypothetical protein
LYHFAGCYLVGYMIGEKMNNIWHSGKNNVLKLKQLKRT